jgi:hypothetical protein
VSRGALFCDFPLLVASLVLVAVDHVFIVVKSLYYYYY